jgi:hypothetical protein
MPGSELSSKDVIWGVEALLNALVEVLHRIPTAQNWSNPSKTSFGESTNGIKRMSRGMQSAGDAFLPARERLSAEEREEIIEKSRIGVTSRVLAEQYDVTQAVSGRP